MKIFKLFALCTLLALLLVPAAVFAQEQAAPERGVVEFGFRGVTGEVYGRTFPASTALPGSTFSPDVLNSGLNTYQDHRSGFYIPKFNALLDGIFGSNNYLRIQSASNGFAFEGGGSLTRDQSVLVTFGQYGHYKMQFRFDETPHIFSGTTRTLFSSNGAGGWTLPAGVQSTTYACLNGTPNAGGITGCPITNQMFAGFTTSAANSAIRTNGTISSLVAGGLVAGVDAQPFTQQESRKALTGSMSWNITPDVNVNALFSREHQLGTRPIGFVMGNGSTGYAAEAPESIDYYTNNVKIATEFGRKNWDASLGYQGSFFQNDTPSMVVENPFSTVYNNTTVGPATGRMDLYPDNKYQQFVGQGAVQIGKHISLMANVTPGWMSQNANFQPLTTNTYVNLTPDPGYPAFLPAQSLNGKVDTLAMNYTAVLKATKDLKFVAKYQHYKYDDGTPEMLVRPVIADTAFLTSFHGATAWFDPLHPAESQLAAATNSPTVANYRYYAPSEHSSFTTRLFDIGGTWFFTKKNSVKFGYQRGWTDRTQREVAESIEDSVYAALDMRLRKDLTFRVSGRHQNRVPQEYEIDTSNYYSRMLDQSSRVRNRGDVSLQWDATQKLSLSAFWGTLQDNYNQRGGVNSPVPLGDATYSAGTGVPTPIYGPYYAYGLLTNVGRNYGVDVNYALTPKVVLFAEYAREKNTGIMIEGRGLNTPATCTPTGAGFVYPSSCDPINDLLTAPKDVVNSYYGGVDVTASKKLDFSLYYSLSLAQSFNFSDGVNCQIGNGWTTGTSRCDTQFTNWSLDQAAYPAVNFGYPQNVNRIHEVGVVTRFKLTDSLVPKFQYVFRQFANNDWQTGAVNPYSFAGTTADSGGATALQKMLFLGADQPSYRAHVFTATLEYHF
ncbi:MAG: MtrB/PioB family outer membrane beta-barrel protein [Acidobacteriia bacterium]|nr:MtrB/PioB family outer membrane beta-barrel protein [Terriglobia bacterium]